MLTKSLDDIMNDMGLEPPRERRRPSVDPGSRRERNRPSRDDRPQRNAETESPKVTRGGSTETSARSRIRTPSNDDASRPSSSRDDPEPPQLESRSRSTWARPKSERQSVKPEIQTIEKDSDIPMTEQEKEEQDKARQELARLQAAKRDADRYEAQMVNSEREKKAAMDRQRRGSIASQKSLVSSTPADSSVLVADYIRAVMTTIRNDKTVSPMPDDFREIEAYENWRSTIRISFQELLIKMIKYRFMKKEQTPGFEPVRLNLFVKEAADLVSRDGKTRDAYCTIEYGDLQNSKSKNRPVFQTDVAENSNNPIWDQRMTVEANSLTDIVLIQVLDKRKDQFLGQVCISMGEMIAESTKNGRYERWLDLEEQDKKGLIGNRNKFVGGQILIVATMLEDTKKSVGKNYNEIQNMLSAMMVDNRSMYDILCRACLTLDIFTPKDRSSSWLSPETIAMLKTWSHTWNITTEYRFIGYAKAMFEKFLSGDVSVRMLKEDVELLYTVIKKSNRTEPYDVESVLVLLSNIRDHCSDQVTRYKEAFPKNQPKNALEDTVFILRIIHKFPGFREKHPGMPDSFRDELKYMLTNSALTKFQSFRQIASPDDDSNVSQVIDGVSQLADLIDEEIQLDIKYYEEPFKS
jgi:hypothetical protein